MERATGPCPILVLASGQRCGSTLIQRLLSSHPDVMIWGEHGGHLREVMGASKQLAEWNRDVSEPARAAWEADRYQSWMANLLPKPEFVARAARAYFTTLFAVPAAASGRRRWGFKEVRFGLGEAHAVRKLFEGTTVIHVTRNPRDVLVSLDRWERMHGWWRRDFTKIAIADWVRITDSFTPGREPAGWVTSWRFEDVVADPDGFIHAISGLLDLDPQMLDRSVFDRRLTDLGPVPKVTLRDFGDLPSDLRSLLDDQVQSIAAARGYPSD